MSDESTSRAWGLFGRARRGTEADRPQHEAALPSAGTVYATKALRKFLGTLTSRPNPVLLDLGPVIGSNVSFFGEQLGCKIFVEDLYADVDRYDQRGALGELTEFLGKRFPQPEGSIDGILCWDLLDFVDQASAQALAVQLSRLLSVDGALLGFFSTSPVREATFTKYVVVDDMNLRHRPYGPVRTRSRVLQNRDIIRLFDGLRVSDSFLLQTNIREILFRKPSYLASAGRDA